MVPTELVSKNAIRVRFEEGWGKILVWKSLGKRKISCILGCSSVMITMFLKIYESFERKRQG